MAQQQSSKAPAATQPASDKPNKPAQDEKIIEFVPFGAKDKIQLSIALVRRLIAVKTKSGKSCSDEDAVKFMLMCQARHLNPFEGDAFLIGYDTNDGPKFSLITAHQAFLKRAEVHQEFDGMESGVIVLRGGETLDLVGDWHMPNDNVLGGWATVFFKNRKYPMKKRLRLTRFNKGFGVWKEDPAGMIVKCAEADALRSAFPTQLGGMFTQEESPAILQAETIPHAEFPAEVVAGAAATIADNGDAMRKALENRASTTEQPAPEATAAPAGKPAEKPQPTLQRRKRAEPKTETPAAPAKPAAPAQPTDRERLKSMLAMGNCTPEDFVALAVDEGWLPPEQGSWDKIPDERFAEFLKAENWVVVTELLDARKSAAPATTTSGSSAPEGQLL